VTVSPERADGADSGDLVEADPAVELGRSFKGAMAAVRRLRGRETRRPGELSDAQYTLLFGLREHSELSARELADLADLSPATTTEMLDGLTSAGLVVRVRSERDRRVVLTSLTDRGRALVEERHARYEPRFRAALAGFSDDELLSAAAVMDGLREFFEELAEERPQP
jgi:MarR family transcriptional regulator, organic hydroperoxide resistance regulator